MFEAYNVTVVNRNRFTLQLQYFVSNKFFKVLKLVHLKTLNKNAPNHEK